MAARVRALLDEARRLDGMLSSYAASPPPVSGTVSVAISALEHYPFAENADCGCDVCLDWNRHRGEFIEVGRLVPKGHKWSTCDCVTCRVIGRIHLNFLAATNRRDLLIEFSFHSPFGEQVMAWLSNEMRKSVYTVNWCAQEMSRYPLEWWMRRCQVALGPVVSGEVFGSNRGVEPLSIAFASSLTADGVMSFG
jgi:hypothetical protein